MSEEEIKATVAVLFNRGLVVEPAGTAALAAVLTGKVSTFISFFQPYCWSTYNFLIIRYKI